MAKILGAFVGFQGSQRGHLYMIDASLRDTYLPSDLSLPWGQVIFNRKRNLTFELVLISFVNEGYLLIYDAEEGMLSMRNRESLIPSQRSPILKVKSTA